MVVVGSGEDEEEWWAAGLDGWERVAEGFV